MTKDPLTILGVPYDASDKEIAGVYRRLAMEHHPDVSNGQDSISRMQEINWAYEVLSQPEKRRSYYTKQHSNGKNGSRTNGKMPGSNGKTATANGPGHDASSYPTPPMEIFGGTADRAIIGAGVGLTVLAVSLIFGLNFASFGALIALLLGVWIGSGPNARMSSQNGTGIGGVIGLFYGAIIGVSIFDPVESSALTTGLLICAPSMILLGASMGAMLGGLAAGLRKLQA
jgi:curved DNA-binding protein CbpA